jgi:predicted ATPase
VELAKLRVEAFRSLYDVTLAPRHFTVIVGANNAGKSNLGEGFEFLAELHRHGLEIAVNRKGGFENIAHRRMRRTKRPLAFDATVLFKQADLPYLSAEARRRRRTRPPEEQLPGLERDLISLRHRFEIHAAGQAIGADFAVGAEILQISATAVGGRETSATITRDRKSNIKITAPHEADVDETLRSLFRGFEEPYADVIGENLEPTSLLTPALALFNPVVRDMERRLSAIHLYRLTPLECRKPGAPTPNPDLDLHGANLPAVVDYMQRTNPQAWKLTLSAMQTIVPGLREIRTGFTHDRRLTLQFVEDGVGRPWTVEEISDGTIQSLALFASVFDSRVPVSFIEEPENAVHPWVVRAFVDACRAVTSKQILVTTHSPALIGYLDPKEVMVVWREDGRSILEPLTNLDDQAVGLWSSGEISTFDLVDSGYVRQAIPQGLT